MKKGLLVVLLSMFCLTGNAEVNQDPQKFEVTYTIVYNAISLEEAADKEVLLKKRFKDACSVKVKAKAVKDFSSSSNLLFTYD